MTSNLAAEAAIEVLTRDSAKYSTRDALRELTRQISIDSPGKVTVLYSGWIGDIKSEAIALELAEKTAQPIINNTPRAQFLTHHTVDVSIKGAAARIFESLGQSSEIAEKSAVDFLLDQILKTKEEIDECF